MLVEDDNELSMSNSFVALKGYEGDNNTEFGIVSAR